RDGVLPLQVPVRNDQGQRRLVCGRRHVQRPNLGPVAGGSGHARDRRHLREQRRPDEDRNRRRVPRGIHQPDREPHEPSQHRRPGGRLRDSARHRQHDEHGRPRAPHGDRRAESAGLQRRSRDDAGHRGGAGARRRRRTRRARTGAGNGRLHDAAPVHGFLPRQLLEAVGVTPRRRDHLQHRRRPWRRRRVHAGLRSLPRADHRHVEGGVMAVPVSYNVRSLYVRRKLTMLAVGGIALVIAVLIVLMAMANGFRVALRATGSPINAIVTQRGSRSELSSAITRDSAQVLSDDSRVMKDANGRALVSPELVVVANMRRRDGADINVTVRGVSQMAFTVRTGLKVTDGRNFQPGLYEVIVGRNIFTRIEGMEIGRSFKLQRRDWKVVGVFDADGSAFESEIWGDGAVVGPAFNRDGYHSVTLRMRDPSPISALNSELEDRPRMQVQAVQESKYYEDQSGLVSGQLLGLAVFVAIVMGIGAVFGAMNTMYALVAARTREIGTLRALGFSK